MKQDNSSSIPDGIKDCGQALDHIVLTVRSVPATVAFYEKLLGMRHEVFTSPKDRDIER